MLAAASAPIDLNHEAIRAKEPVMAPAPSYIKTDAEPGLESIVFSVRDSIYNLKFINNWTDRNYSPKASNILTKKVLPISLSTQQGNTCGPTSLYMSVRALGVSCTQSEIEKNVFCSPWIGTSPKHIKEAASNLGLSAAIRNNATTQTVRSVIDSGGYAIALIQKSNSLHYVVIYGYVTNEKNETEFEVADPNGFTYTQEAKYFNNDWSNLHFRGIDLGFNRLIIAVNKERTFADSFDGKGSIFSSLHGLINRFTNFLGELLNFLGSFCSLIGNIFSGIDAALPSQQNKIRKN